MSFSFKGVVYAGLSGLACFMPGCTCVNLGQTLSLLTAVSQASQTAMQQGLDPRAAEAAAVFATIKADNISGQDVANQINAISPGEFTVQDGDLVVQVANLPGMGDYSTNKCLVDRTDAVGINLYGGSADVAPATAALNATGPLPNGAPQPPTCNGVTTPPDAGTPFTQDQVDAVARAVKWARLINLGQ